MISDKIEPAMIKNPKTSKELIKEILDKKEYERFVGLIEDQHFDAKKGLPNLSEESQQIEICKDVTSLANLDGGYLIYGLATKPYEKGFGEGEVSDCIGITGYDLKKIKDTLKNKTHPNISHIIKIETFRLISEKDLLVIEIDSKNKPYFVHNISVFDSKKTNGLSFGYFERTFDQSEPSLTIRDIYRTFKRDAVLEQKIDLVLEEVRNIKQQQGPADTAKNDITEYELEKTAKKEHSQDNLESKISDILQQDSFSNRRSIILSAQYDPKPEEVEGIFSGDNDVFQLVKNPPYFRRAGWDLQTLDEPKIKEGKYLEVRNGDRKILRVYRDGTVVFAGLADPSFLAFGYEEEEEKGKKYIRAIAVAEVIANFCQFLEVLRVHLKPQPKQVAATLRFSNPQRDTITLVKGVLGAIDLDSWTQTFTTNKDISTTPSKTAKIENNEIDWEKLAYELYKEFAYIFGRSDTNLWFVKDNKIDIGSFGK